MITLEIKWGATWLAKRSVAYLNFIACQAPGAPDEAKEDNVFALKRFFALGDSEGAQCPPLYTQKGGALFETKNERIIEKKETKCRR